MSHFSRFPALQTWSQVVEITAFLLGGGGAITALGLIWSMDGGWGFVAAGAALALSLPVAGMLLLLKEAVQVILAIEENTSRTIEAVKNLQGGEQEPRPKNKKSKPKPNLMDILE
tara:strand:- start:115 stop:459 length:345 start_codon:yes stop_codon:yes gene_type:complete